jgi:hypothetical protein
MLYIWSDKIQQIVVLLVSKRTPEKHVMPTFVFNFFLLVDGSWSSLFLQQLALAGTHTIKLSSLYALPGIG